MGTGAGAVELLAALRRTRPAARVLARAPEAPLEAVYHAIARNRSRLGRLVPDGPAPRRFP